MRLTQRGSRLPTADQLEPLTPTSSEETKMAILAIHYIGTTEIARTNHDDIAGAQQALADFARGYDIQGDGYSGTLTIKSGRVNQAAYTWRIEA